MATFAFLMLCVCFFQKCAKTEDDISWPTNITMGILSSNMTIMTNSSDRVNGLYELIANETIKDLRNDKVIPDNMDIKTYVTRMKICDDTSAIRAFMYQWRTYNPDVFFGPECSEAMSIAALLAADFDKPIMDYFTVSTTLSNVTKYPTIVRFYYTMKFMSQAINALFNEFRWTSLTIVRTSLDGSCDTYLSGIYSSIGKFNIEVKNDLNMNLTNKENVANVMQIVHATARIILLCAGPSPADAVDFLTTASEFGMMTSEYVYIIPEYKKFSIHSSEPWLEENNQTSLPEAKRLKSLYTNCIIIRPAGDVINLYTNYTKRLQTLLEVKYQSSLNTEDLLFNMLRLAPLRDAIYSYFKTVNSSIESGQRKYVGRGAAFLNAFSSVEFAGITGRMVFDEISNRIPDYELLKMNDNQEMVPVFTLGVNLTMINKKMTVLNYLSSPFWTTSDRLAPKTVPLCGFLNEHCQPVSYSGIYVGLPIALIFILFLIITGFYVYKKNAFEKGLMEASWKLDMSQFIIISHSNSIYSTESKLRSEGSLSKNEDMLKFTDECNKDMNGVFEGCGMYKDMIVAVKRWPKRKHIVLSNNQITLLQQIRSLNHDNLNRFVGLSVDYNDTVVCFWAYCAKHSLQDIIFNDDIRLDMSFKVSILRDIATGLEYLHASVLGYHGRLFLTNCLVDSRWVVKITGFGIFSIINETTENSMATSAKIEKLLCTPPEVLKNMPITDCKPLDMYQFAMIAYQVLVREEPFAELEKSGDEILAMLKNPYIPPTRPSLSNIKDCDPRIIRLIELGFHSDPAIRPKAFEAKKEIFHATRIFGKNLLDHAMNMLEKYASNLESIVAERTTQLNDEKKRADKLLYQMLPKSVADCLKTGQPVIPETFECATVYFSDVVGFTTICARSSPLQVVQMLNSLYSTFDEIISSFNAFKVETIGDAYLVVSGLPVRNGIKHVADIADMSLKIINVLDECRIPHMPGHKLLIRIGLNSGPVACGVIGLTMPRYCVFGDTVNFASRMESTGDGGKIHMTEATKNLLCLNEEYVIEKRGEIQVKGKGLCTTYWLIKKNEKILK